MGKVWLIGGTQESRHLVERGRSRLGKSSSLPLIVTVTTAAARQLYPSLSDEQVWVGKLTLAAGTGFLATHQVAAILDMSHPFAQEISQLAMALAKHCGLPYLRYERPAVAPTPWRDRRDRAGLVTVNHLSEILASNHLLGERSLLILGYQSLQLFRPWQTRADLFVRILPSAIALEAALTAGFTAARIFALRPPIAAALEQALWEQWHITQVVAKASGAAGGEDQKHAIAARLGVRLLLVQRPSLDYPRQTDNIDTALQFVLRYGT